jgi:cytochrome P450
VSVRPFYFDDAAAAAVSDGWRQVLALGPTDRMESWLRATFDARGARMDFVASMREGVSDLRAWRSARGAMRRRAAMRALTFRRGRPELPRHELRVLDDYAAVRDALRSPERFSSALPTRLDRSAASLDPPHHDQQRAVLRRLLSAARGEPLEQLCETATRDLLGPHRADSEIDMVEVLATPLSEEVLGRVVGLEAAPLQRFADTARGPFGAGARKRVLAALDAVSPLPPPMQQVIDELGAHEGRDLLRMLWLAGTDTVRRGVASTVRVLGRDDSRARLLDSPELVDPFVDEVLRLHPPEPTLWRREAGGNVVGLSLELANRDPGQFPEPHAIDLARRPSHLGFGAGPHRCPGAVIARAELAAVVRVILELMPEFELVELPTEDLVVRPAPARELSSGRIAE